MRYGFIYTGDDPVLAVELAERVEATGWDAFFVWEGVWDTDPWAVLAAAAVRTERIRLGTMLTPVPRRRPWELASQTMTVDRLSGGRVILSAGLGVPASVAERFWLFEDDPGRQVRAEQLDESLELIERLWRSESFAFEGRHYRAKPATGMVPPTAVQQPRITTWGVGVWPRTRSMRRVARLDGWIPNYAPPGAEVSVRPAEYTPEVAAEAIAWIRDERARLGLADRPYDVTQEGTTSGTDASSDADRVRPWAEAGVTWWLEADWSIPHEEVPDYARRRAEAGPPRG